MYPVQYLRNHTTTRVPSPGPTAKILGTMAQDSVQKKKKKKKREKSNKIKSRVHIVNRSTYC